MSNFIVYQVRNLQEEWTEANEDIFKATSPARRRKLQVMPTIEAHCAEWEDRHGNTYWSCWIWQGNDVVASLEGQGPTYSGDCSNHAVALLQQHGLIPASDTRNATIVLADNNVAYHIERSKTKRYLYRN